jgi:monovalent cation/hydrogen antiporter
MCWPVDCVHVGQCISVQQKPNNVEHPRKSGPPQASRSTSQCAKQEEKMEVQPNLVLAVSALPPGMSPVATFELALALMSLAIAIYWGATRAGLPPAAALLVGGGLLAFVPGLPSVSLDPELALVFFLPPLLMDGAYFTAFGRFRRHLPSILSLAVGAVIFTTLLVGIVVHWLVPQLPWAACFALGAIVSPPDAVSARAVLQRVVVPRRLTALIEGESLLNDATGLVLFRFAVAAALSGMFDAGDAVQTFFSVAIGGILVGLAVAGAWVLVIRRLGNETLIIATTTISCWGAYLLGEAVHVSGVIATVSAGLALGWYQHVTLPASVRLRGRAFWQTMVFLLEALVFILIGFTLRDVVERVNAGPATWGEMIIPIAAVVVTTIIARFIWVLGIEGIVTALKRVGWHNARPLGWSQAAVLGWAGMRGVVTLAVALTLPQDMPGRDLMLLTAMAVIFVTVVLQGTSLGWLIRKVHLVDTDAPAKISAAEAEAVVAAAKTAAVELRAFDANGALIHPQLRAEYRKRLKVTQNYAKDAEAFMNTLGDHFDIVLDAISAGRRELLKLHRAGLIEDEVLHDLERDLDVEEFATMLQKT